MRKRILVALAGAGLLVWVVPVLAHHAFSAEFDANRPVKLKGTVVKMEWVNPHSWIHLEVKGTDGNIIAWAIEIGAPNAMFRRGFTKNSLPAGVEVMVDGFQSKDGSLRANGRNVTFPDGRILFVGGAGAEAPSQAAEPGQK